MIYGMTPGDSFTLDRFNGKTSYGVNSKNVRTLFVHDIDLSMTENTITSGNRLINPVPISVAGECLV